VFTKLVARSNRV